MRKKFIGNCGIYNGTKQSIIKVLESKKKKKLIVTPPDSLAKWNHIHNLSQGIGSSITGFVHGLLFCVLTKEVRGTMLKGLWNGLISCEHCIYDRTFMCCKTKHSDHVHPLDDKTQLSDPNAFREMLDPASSEYSVMSEYDIIQSPDPTTSVSITQIPGPRFAQHFEDERENS